MKYCAKHNQEYRSTIPVCPICRGEMLAGLPGVPLGPCKISEEYIPNKRGLYLVEPQPVICGELGAVNEKGERPARPVQMELF